MIVENHNIAPLSKIDYSITSQTMIEYTDELIAKYTARIIGTDYLPMGGLSKYIELMTL